MVIPRNRMTYRHCDDSNVTVSASEYVVHLGKKKVKSEFVLDFFQIGESHKTFVNSLNE